MAKKQKRSKPASNTTPAPAPQSAPEQERAATPESFASLEGKAFKASWQSIAKEWRVLLVMLVLAVATRFFGLSDISLWMDEIVILQEAYTGKYSTVSYSAHAAHLTPVSICMRIFGQNAFGLRFWGALLGALSVPLTFVWARLLLDRATAIGVSLLSLANGFLLLYAQDGNYYGGMTFYTTLALCCYALFFRGAPLLGFAALIPVSLLNFWNHPIAALPSAAIAGGMFVGSLLFPSLRNQLYATKMEHWVRRPALPLLAAAVVLTSPYWLKAAPELRQFATQVITPGETSLTNVEFGWPIFRDHMTALTVSFFRMGALERMLMAAPALFAIAGVVICGLRWRKERQPGWLAFPGLLLVLAGGSYFLLFSLNLNRNFNLRYFIYLTPLLLGSIAVAGAEINRALEAKQPALARFQLGLAPPLLIAAVFTLNYLMTDKGNYREGAELLAETRTDETILLPVRNDRIQAEFYLQRNNLPTRAPGLLYLNQPAFADRMAGAFPFAMAGEDLLITSAWRYVEAPKLWTMLGSLPELFNGTSKLSSPHDLRIWRWNWGAGQLLLPRLAARIPQSGEVFRTGPGAWMLDSELLEFPKPGLMEAEQGLYRPVLNPIEVYLPSDAINSPAHAKISQVVQDGRTYLRNERDGSLDFMLYHPSDQPRHLVIHMKALDFDDPLMEKNSAPITNDFCLSIAINGKHQKIWRLEGESGEPLTLTPDLDIPFGNSRITINVFTPRLGYTPYFPWHFEKLEWREGGADRVKPGAAIPFSAGWPQIPAAGEQGGRLSNGWQAAGLPAGIDDEMTAPGGDPAIRIDVPGEAPQGLQVVAPPMRVNPGEVALYWFYYRLRGLENLEGTPMVIFTDSNGKPIVRTFANGPNMRGSTHGEWIRRQVCVPVPEGAVYLAPGIQFFPYKGETEGATIWLGSLAAPQTNANFRDPAMPEIIGVGDE